MALLSIGAALLCDNELPRQRIKLLVIDFQTICDIDVNYYLSEVSDDRAVTQLGQMRLMQQLGCHSPFREEGGFAWMALGGQKKVQHFKQFLHRLQCHGTTIVLSGRGHPGVIRACLEETGLSECFSDVLVAADSALQQPSAFDLEQGSAIAAEASLQGAHNLTKAEMLAQLRAGHSLHEDEVLLVEYDTEQTEDLPVLVLPSGIGWQQKNMDELVANTAPPSHKQEASSADKLGSEPADKTEAIAAAQEDCEVRAVLRGTFSEPKLQMEPLLRSLRRAASAVDSAHKAIHTEWRGSITLFTPAEEDRKRVPLWATHAVLQAKAIILDATEVGHLVASYENQLLDAERNGTRIDREAVLKLLAHSDNVCERLEQVLPLVRKARQAFDKPLMAPHLKEPRLLHETQRPVDLNEVIHETVEPPSAPQQLYESMEPTMKKSMVTALEYAVNLWDWGAAALEKAAAAPPSEPASSTKLPALECEQPWVESRNVAQEQTSQPQLSGLDEFLRQQRAVQQFNPPPTDVADSAPPDHQFGQPARLLDHVAAQQQELLWRAQQGQPARA